MPKSIEQFSLFEQLAAPGPAPRSLDDDPFDGHPTEPIECYSFHERRILPWLSGDMTLARLAYCRIHFRNCAVEFRPATTSVRNYTIKRLDEKSGDD